MERRDDGAGIMGPPVSAWWWSGAQWCARMGAMTGSRPAIRTSLAGSSGGAPGGDRPAQGDRPQQVVGEGLPEQHREGPGEAPDG